MLPTAGNARQVALKRIPTASLTGRPVRVRHEETPSVTRSRAIRVGLPNAALAKPHAVTPAEVPAAAVRYQLPEGSKDDAESAVLLRKVKPVAKTPSLPETAPVQLRNGAQGDEQAVRTTAERPIGLAKAKNVTTRATTRPAIGTPRAALGLTVLRAGPYA